MDDYAKQTVTTGSWTIVAAPLVKRPESNSNTQQLYRRRACDRCVARKTRCDSQNPCQSCASACQSCNYSFIKRHPPRKRASQRKLAPSTKPVLAPRPLVSCDRGQAVAPALTKTSASLALVIPAAIPSPESYATHSLVTPQASSSPGGAPRQELTATATAVSSAEPVHPLAEASLVQGWERAGQEWDRFSDLLARMIQAFKEHQITDDTSALMDVDASVDSNQALARQEKRHAEHIVEDFHYQFIEYLQYLGATNQRPKAANFFHGALGPGWPHWMLMNPQPHMFQLQSSEDHLYNKCTVFSFVSTYIGQQIRAYHLPYFQRLWRMIERNTISPFALSVILCVGAASTIHNSLTLNTRQRIHQMYLERCDAMFSRQTENPSLETPYAIFLCAGSCLAVKNTNRFVYYLSMAIQLVSQLHFYICDLPNRPVAPLAVPKVPGRPASTDESEWYYSPDDPLVLEYQRRTLWDIVYSDVLTNCFMGTSSSLTKPYLAVGAIDDRLVEKLLNLDSANDPYPAMVPALRVMVCGYAYMNDFQYLAIQVTNLRARAQEHVFERDIAQYRTLAFQLATWYDRLQENMPFPTSLAVVDQMVRLDPTRLGSILLTYGIYHSYMLFLTCHNWNAGYGVIRPELDPECHRFGMASAAFITNTVMPFLVRLPTHHFPILMMVPAFCAALKYILVLAHDKGSGFDYYAYEDTLARITAHMQFLESLQEIAYYANFCRSQLKQCLEVYQIKVLGQTSTAADKDGQPRFHWTYLYSTSNNRFAGYDRFYQLPNVPSAGCLGSPACSTRSTPSATDSVDTDDSQASSNASQRVALHQLLN
ncbi:hypothetical protein H4R35_005704 [Dimargaris xerosporica]|nr:hypothetical protein H4R35_005704 [Dimargaris xerosporica]